VKRYLDTDSILLTRRELQIMKVVWDDQVVTVKDVQDVLSKERAVAYTTVLTFMKILEAKGALSHARHGRAFVYRPVISRQQATRNQVRDVMDRYFDGCPGKLLADVLNHECKSPEQLRDAKDMMTGTLKRLNGGMGTDTNAFVANESLPRMLDRTSRKSREYEAAGLPLSASAAEN